MNINGWIHNGGTVMHLYSSLKYEDGKEKRVMKGRKREIRQLLKCVTVRRGFWPADLLHGFLHISPPFCSPSSSILFTMGRAFARRRLYKLHVFQGAHSVVDFVEVGGPSADRYVGYNVRLPYFSWMYFNFEITYKKIFVIISFLDYYTCMFYHKINLKDVSYILMRIILLINLYYE